MATFDSKEAESSESLAEKVVRRRLGESSPYANCRELASEIDTSVAES